MYLPLLALAASLQAATSAELQRTLDSARTAIGAPGMAATVIFADGSSWTGVSGLATAGRPVTPETAFALGSITKTYVATAVLRLAAEGRIDLDDAVRGYLPEAPAPMGTTVRQLLNHTGGLADPMQSPSWLPQMLAALARVWDPAETLALMGPPAFEPGAGWGYSNGGYLLLGLLLEAVTAEPAQAALRRLVLDPLGLGATAFVLDGPAPAGAAHAWIDITGDDTPDDVGGLISMTAFRTSAFTAGAMFATAGDAAVFMRAVHDGHALPPDWYAEMTDLVDRPDGLRYGLGVLALPDLAGHRAYGHKGNQAGFSASAFHLPGPRVTVAVVSNAHLKDVTPVVEALLLDLLDDDGEIGGDRGDGADGGPHR